MKRTHLLCFCAGFIGLGLTLAAAADMQSAIPPGPERAPQPAAKVPRRPDGRPDLSGTWTFATITPLERPAEFAGKEVLSAQERLAVEQKDAIQQEAYRQGQTPGTPSGTYGADFWERGASTGRTALIIDPPDGRIPPLTDAGADRRRARAERLNSAAGPEDRNVGERCLLGLNAGPPMLPGPYNNNLQIFQTPDHVAILNEMVHNARIVPIKLASHLSFPQWSGNSRGRWDGDVFVVDTVGFREETSFPGSSPNLHLIERFTRVDAKTLLYVFTVDDPTTWTRPWTASIPMQRLDELIYEYACHEGNEGLASILHNTRLAEKEKEAAEKSQR